MVGALVAKTLKPVGLYKYKVNDEYMDSMRQKLEEIDAGMNEVAKIADSSSQIIYAVNSGDTSKAVDATLKLCKIVDEVEELRDIQQKIAQGETTDIAVATANTPELTRYIKTSLTMEINDGYTKVTRLLANIVAVDEEITEKLRNVRSASVNWSLAEKLGTSEALRDTMGKVKQVQKSAEERKDKLETLKQSIQKNAMWLD